MTTVAEALAGLGEKWRKEWTEEQWRQRILSLLPPELECPTVSNIGMFEKKGPRMFGGWVSWRAGYSNSAPKGADILERLEGAGFEYFPATLAKYGNYRASPKPGKPEDMPAQSSREDLRDAQEIAPLWLDLSTFGNSAIVHLRQGDILLKVSVPCDLMVHLSAEREGEGRFGREGWHYKRGTQRVHHNLHNVHTCACFLGGDAYNSQSLDGYLTFNPTPTKPSDILRGIP